MTATPVTRASYEHLKSFIPPKGLFPMLAGKGVASASADWPPAVEAGRQALVRGLEKALTDALVPPPPPAVRAAPPQGRFRRMGQPVTPLPAPTSTQAAAALPQPAPKLLRCSVDECGVEVVVVGANEQKLATVWAEALNVLGVATVDAPSIERVVLEGTDVPAIRLRIGREAEQLAVYCCDENSQAYKGLLAEHPGIGQLRNLVLHLQDGRQFNALAGWGAVLRDAQLRGLQALTADPARAESRKTEMAARLAATEGGELERAREYLAGLSLEGVHDLGLCILTEWYDQRDSWHRHEVELTDGTVLTTPGRSLIFLEPERLKALLMPGVHRGRNWRQTIWKRLLAMAAVEQCNDWGRGGISTIKALLAGAVDSRKPRQGSPGLGNAVVEALARANLTSVNGFFVCLDSAWAGTILPQFTDASGSSLWGHQALIAMKRQGRSGDEKAKAAHARAMKRPNAHVYFTVYPEVLALANAAGWSDLLKSLFFAVLAEPTSRPMKRRRKDQVTREVPDGLASYNGGGKYGYTLQTWMKKAGYLADSKASVSRTRKFLHDVARLKEDVGLVVNVDDYAVVNEDLSRLAHICRPSKPIPPVKLWFFLPEDVPALIEARLAGRGIALPAPSKREMPSPLSTPGALLREARKRVGMTQADLASRLGVSKAMVCQWETGKKAISPERLESIQQILEVDEAA